MPADISRSRSWRKSAKITFLGRLTQELLLGWSGNLLEADLGVLELEADGKPFAFELEKHWDLMPLDHLEIVQRETHLEIPL